MPLPGEFLSGAHRGRFNPKDGQLYLCGLKGWGTKAKSDGCFHRVRYTGKSVTMPTGLRVGPPGGSARTYEQPVFVPQSLHV